jgi:N-acetylglucosamine-6-phosphate deacetylase
VGDDEQEAAMTVLTGVRVVTPAGVLDQGFVEIQGTTIADVGTGAPPPGTDRVDLGGGWLLPGYIDIHVHGGGGHDFTTSPHDLAGGVAFHRSRGTTRTLASLVTASVDTLTEQLQWIAAAARRGPHAEGHVLGAHLEGPFLCQTRRGAQHPGHIIDPDQAALSTLLKAGQGYVRQITVAPENAGALELIDQATAEGVLVAVGHTDATYDQAAAAFARGASLVTHAFNGMRPPHHREPGPVPAALDARAVCEVINDGVHVHPAAVRMIAEGRADRIVLITDAIDATGFGDGNYQLGGQDVIVKDGQARLAADGALAGSTLTMDEAVRRAIVEVGLPVTAASAAASGNPARLLGIADQCGAVAAGLDADLVVLDDEYRLCRVMAQGSWVR